MRRNAFQCNAEVRASICVCSRLRATPIVSHTKKRRPWRDAETLVCSRRVSPYCFSLPTRVFLFIAISSQPHQQPLITYAARNQFNNETTDPIQNIYEPLNECKFLPILSSEHYKNVFAYVYIKQDDFFIDLFVWRETAFSKMFVFWRLQRAPVQQVRYCQSLSEKRYWRIYTV